MYIVWLLRCTGCFRNIFRSLSTSGTYIVICIKLSQAPSVTVLGTLFHNDGFVLLHNPHPPSLLQPYPLIPQKLVSNDIKFS